MATVISVNGEHGSILAKSSGLRLLQEESRALVLHEAPLDATRDGRPGVDAEQAIIGSPGGTLAVRLSESNSSQGAIQVDRISYSSTQEPPENVEIPVGRDLLLTAIGGDGEPGQTGGNGGRGLDGMDGIGASKGSDATHGTAGGRGGDAGHGSNGASGGPGGAIHVIVHENSTHLLMAVDFDVKGGRPGGPGHHGEAGAGGRGGSGGKGWRWEEIVGYKPICTDSCIKADGYAPNRTGGMLTRVQSRATASSTALIAQVGAVMVNGDNLQRMIQQAAVRHNAQRQSFRRDDGACKCGGGSGSCAGCDVRPIIKTFARAPGLAGKDGENGQSITTPLSSGILGHPGTVTIAVYGDDNRTQEYHSVWSLELLDFDIEDENEDGVFEPGEHIFIRRIKIRNTGGMPSPSCAIPVTLADNTDWFEKVPDDEGGRAFLPPSIPAGGTASTVGSIKVRIKEPTHANSKPLAPGTPLSAKDTLRIRADMPWLGRKVPFCDVSKEVEIGYPCGFGEFQHLSTVAQGLVSVVQYEVHNRSNRPLGTSNTIGQQRKVEVRAMIPAEYGRLIEEQEEEEAFQNVPSTRPRDSTSMEQQFCILPTAQCHEHFNMCFEMYIENPLQDPQSEMLQSVLVEWQNVRIQVSNAYNPKRDADFLLITNPGTSVKESRALQLFIQNDLGMEVDLCNVHENGGLLKTSEADFEEPEPITAIYKERTIVGLDNTFQFFGAGDRTLGQLWDPQWLCDVAVHGNSNLFVGSENDKAFMDITISSVFPIHVTLEKTLGKIPRARIFTSNQDLVQCIVQERQFGNCRIGLSAIALRRSRWYRFGTDRAKRRARELAEHLSQYVPNERFLVSYLAPDKHSDVRVPLPHLEGDQLNSGGGHIIVFTGLGHHSSILSTDSKISTDPVQEASAIAACLSLYDKYTIIAAMPLHRRVALLWEAPFSDDFLIKAITLSVQKNVFDQIRHFNISASRIVPRVENSKDFEPFCKAHLPCISAFIAAARGREPGLPPVAILAISQWVLACAAAAKRHGNLEAMVASMIEQCPSIKGKKTPSHRGINVDMRAEHEDSLMKEIAELTKTPQYIFTRGQRSASSDILGTRFCAPEEWNTIVQNIQKQRKKLQQDLEFAQKERGRMVVGTQILDVGFEEPGSTQIISE